MNNNLIAHAKNCGMIPTTDKEGFFTLEGYNAPVDLREFAEDEKTILKTALKQLSERCNEYYPEKGRSFTKSRIIITPATNIENNAVVDNSKVEVREYDTDMDIFTLYNKEREHTRRANLLSVSLYNDYIMDAGIEYKILRMQTGVSSGNERG